MSRVDAVMKDTQFNAIVSWAIVAVLLLAGAASISIGEPVWAAFVMGGVAIILLPAGIRRDLTVMPPCEVLVFVALPLTSQFFPLPDALADLTTYLAVLAVGVVGAVELHVFSPVEMTPRFAVVFAVLVTMATAASGLSFSTHPMSTSIRRSSRTRHCSSGTWFSPLLLVSQQAPFSQSTSNESRQLMSAGSR